MRSADLRLDEIVSFGALNDDGMAVRGNAGRTLHTGVEGALSMKLAERYNVKLAGSRSWDRYVDFTVFEDQWDWDTWEYLGTDAYDYAGNPIAGFTAGECEEIAGNYIDQTIYWRGNKDVSTLAGTPIKLYFKLSRAKLSAFQFTEE